MMALDDMYPRLSQLVNLVLEIDLETLASRAPAVGYRSYFDLERLLAHARDDLPVLNAWEFRFHIKQVHGYLATLEEYVARGLVRDPGAFIMKKLAAPKVALAEPQGSEMLDTLAECSWGLWLGDRHGTVEEEMPLPGGNGDADFYVMTRNGPLWVDCTSVAPTDHKNDLGKYLASKVRHKWHTKFGVRPGAATVPAAIAVTLLKEQEYTMPALIRGEITGSSLVPPASLWVDCPGLQVAWFATPPFDDQPHRPSVFATWNRP